MPEELKIAPYLHTALTGDRIPETMLDLLADLHWGRQEQVMPIANEASSPAALDVCKQKEEKT